MGVAGIFIRRVLLKRLGYEVYWNVRYVAKGAMIGVCLILDIELRFSFKVLSWCGIDGGLI